jgi:SAM-dependent methyltransferase
VDLLERPSRTFLRHPWETARFAFFSAILSESLSHRRNATILDAGSGDGWFATQLIVSARHRSASAGGWRVLCWDPSYEASDIERLACSASLGQRIDFTRTLPDGRFPCILLLDVLEHVEDDLEFLTDLARTHLDRDGNVLLSVPCWRILYGQHDRQLGHHRRYDPQTCRHLIRQAGLRIERSGGLFFGPLLVRSMQRALEPLRSVNAASGPPPLSWEHGPTSGTLVRAALRWEIAAARWLERVGLHAPGLSWWALCSREP